MRFIAAALLALVLLAPAQASPDGAVTISAVVTNQDSDDGRTVVIKQLRDKHGSVIGWGDTVCLNLGNGSAQCVGTFVLPKGKINVAGTRHNQDYFVLAIVGGTGLYVGAGGTLIAHSVSVDPRRERLVFLLQ